MSKITFSTKEINTLQNNPNVQRVSEKAITYTDEFKNRFISMTTKLANSLVRFLRRTTLMWMSLA